MPRRLHARAAALSLLALLLSGCALMNDEKSTTTGAPSGSPTGSTSPSSTTEPSTEPTEAADEQLFVGDQPYVSPCRLFPPRAAVRRLPLTREANFTEIGRLTSVPETWLKKYGNRSMAGSIPTSCAYVYGDHADTRLSFTVHQYFNPAKAERRWKRYYRFGLGRLPAKLRGKDPASLDAINQALVGLIEDLRKSFGGVQVKGLDKRILWRMGSQEFFAQTGNLVISLHLGEDFGFSKMLTKKDVDLADSVLGTILKNAEDPTGLSAPLPSYGNPGSDWPRFLNACELLAGAPLETMLPKVTLWEFSANSTDLSPDINLKSDSPGGRSQDNGCTVKTDEVRGPDVELNVQYVAPKDDAWDALYSYVSNLAFGDPKPDDASLTMIRRALLNGGLSDVDASYVWHSGHGIYQYYALKGRYVLELRAKSRYNKKFEGKSLDSLTLSHGMEAVIANLDAAVAAE